MKQYAFISIFLFVTLTVYSQKSNDLELIRTAFQNIKSEDDINKILSYQTENNGKDNHIIQAGVALTFCLLPHWPWAGLSIPGLPFLLYAFLNLRSGNRHFINWVIIAIYPFYSSLVTTGFFFCLLVVLLGITDIFRKKGVKKEFILGLFLLSVLYVISHYRLFLEFFIEPQFVSHRVEFRRVGYGLIGFLKYFTYSRRDTRRMRTTRRLIRSVHCHYPKYIVD